MKMLLRKQGNFDVLGCFMFCLVRSQVSLCFDGLRFSDSGDMYNTFLLCRNTSFRQIL